VTPFVPLNEWIAFVPLTMNGRVISMKNIHINDHFVFKFGNSLPLFQFHLFNEKGWCYRSRGNSVLQFLLLVRPSKNEQKAVPNVARACNRLGYLLNIQKWFNLQSSNNLYFVKNNLLRIQTSQP
jgi:hypothetical protein